MRILHVHKYYHNHDGAGRYMFDVMRLQEQAGHVVAIFAMHDARNAPSVWDKYFVSALDTTRFSCGLNGLFQFARALWSFEARRKLRTLLRAFRPDVVHLHNVYTHLSPSVLSACRAEGVPVVMTVHDYALISANYGLWDGQQKLTPDRLSLLRVTGSRFIKGSYLATFILECITRLHRSLKLYDRAIEVYLPSSVFVRETLVAGGYALRKMRVLPLFAGNLLPEVSIPEPTEPRRGILFAGRLEDYKGIGLFLQAVEAFPELQFFIAGTGPLEFEVLQSCLKYKNLEYLGFFKSAAELWAKMAQVELVVVPSVWPEPFGLVAIEAMACGTPVLVSDAGGLPEKVKDGVNGMVFKSGEIQDLTAKIKMAFKHRGELARLGQGAWRYARAQADPNKHISKLQQIYDEVVIHR